MDKTNRLKQQGRIVKNAIEIVAAYADRATADAERAKADAILASVDRTTPNPEWDNARNERSRILDEWSRADVAFDHAVEEIIKNLKQAGSL